MGAKPTYEELKKRVEALERDIVDHEKMLSAYKRSETNYRSIFNAVNDAVFVHEIETGRILDVNNKMCEMYGYAREEVGLLNAGDLSSGVSPYTKEGAVKRIRRAADGDPQIFEWMAKDKDGKLFWTEVNLKRVLVGGQDRLLAVVRDITTRKKAEEEREKLEAQLSNAVALAHLGYWEHDTIQNMVTLNDHFYRMYKTTAEEVGGYTMSPQEMMQRFVHPDDIEPLLAHIHEISTKADTLSGDLYEHRFLYPDGNVGYLINRILYIKDDSGKVVKTFGVSQDITDRKRVEEALEKRMIALTRPLDDPEGIALEDLFNLDDIQRLQDQFAEATGVASIITNIDGTPITRASNFCRLCSDIIRKTEKGLSNCYKSDAALGRRKSGGPLIQPCLSGGLWDAGTSISIGGKHIANWLIGQVRDETQTDEAMRAYAREIGADEQKLIEAFHEVTPMSREQFGVVARTLFTLAEQISSVAYQNVQQARFIADLKQAGEEKKLLESQLLQAQKMEAVGRLAGGVAHDFNNMLSIIIGHADMVMENMEAANPFLDALKEIKKAGVRSADLTRQLLAFARKQTIAPRRLDLNEAIGKTLKMLQRIIGEDVRLTWIPGKKLWPVKVDPVQLDQVLANLCVNARDAIADIGKITIETENVGVKEPGRGSHSEIVPGEYVRITVSDDGLGMDAETLEKVFEPFYTTKEIGKGTGLGLATVYGIVKQNNGFIDVISAPGQGTAFKLYLPRDDLDTTELSEEGTGRSVHRGSETIMIVEDEPAIINMARMMLESLGYTVLTAVASAEAIRLAREAPLKIDLLIADVIMPEMNGRDLAKEISAFYPDLKILFISGYTADIIAHHGVLDEGVNFISKPFSIEQISAKVREALDVEES